MLEQQLAQTALNKAIQHRGKGSQYASEEGILRFVFDVLHVRPAAYQEDILARFVRERRIAVRGPHGMGKTALSSWIVLWGLSAFDTDVKVLTTASAWRQLTKFTWPEIRKWAAKADWARVGMDVRRNKELLELSIKLPGKEAFAVASDNPAYIEGAHASKLIYVFDEAKAIPVGTWDAAEGAFSTGDCYALAISTPGDPAGRFYDIHSRKPGYEDWGTRHVTLEEAIAAGRISREWAAQRKTQWGEQSAVYQNRVEGEFSDSGEDSVIPLRWVELANERFAACGGKGEGSTGYGVDPARYGEDKTTIAKMVGRVLEALTYKSKQSTMETAGNVAALVDQTTPVGIDTIGLGAGVYDRLKELEYRVVSVNVAESTELKDSTGQNSFVNLRAALWWALREGLDPEKPEPMALPPDDTLTGDLTAPTWTYTSAGAIKVESKDDIRERIGRSTDAADALALAWYVLHVKQKKHRSGFF